MFADYDSDNNGKLEVHEFAECVKHCAGAANPPEIDMLFKVCDRDAKGYLSVTDIEHAFTHVEEAF